MDVFLALTPLLVIVIGIIFLKIPIKWASLGTMVFCFILVILYAFNKGVNPDAAPLATTVAMKQALNGIIDGAKLVFMIWAAFVTMNMLVSCGAMNRIKQLIATVTVDKRKLAIIIGLGFGGFLEGVAGAGTPAAICAPFLMSMGFPLLKAAAIPLIFNGVAASLGAFGLTTGSGFAAYVNLAPTDPNYVNVLQVGLVTGCIHFFGAIAVTLIVSRSFFGKKALTGEHIFFCIMAGVAYGCMQVLLGALAGAEFPTLFSGLFVLLSTIVYCKIRKPVVAEEFRLPASEQSDAGAVDMSAVRAMSTYIIMVLLLCAIRIPGNYNPEWMAFLRKVGFAVWIGTAIFITSFIGSFINKETSKMGGHMLHALQSVIGALFALSCLTAVSNMMKAAGMMTIIANSLVSVTGPVYPAAAVMIGTLGSFVMGTTLGGNILFAPIHFTAAQAVQVPQAILFASNNAGGALGNMVCPNNVVACCATINNKEEGKVMSRIAPILIMMWVLYMILSMIYSYFVFNWMPVM
ncbi:MAG: L-lactate permease [Leptospirales bacterium]|nr:L-lactate permease [Leptospirales bacterium]